MTPTQTIYDQIGGAPAMDAAVDIFYRKVLHDPRISRFFDDVNMGQQGAKLKAFLTVAFGGPNKYSGKGLRRAHAHLAAKGLDDSHFDAVMEHLGATLKELTVPAPLIGEMAAVAESVRNDVLGR